MGRNLAKVKGVVMTVDEALKLTMEEVNAILQRGVRIQVKPSTSCSDEELVKKYDRPGRLKPDEWRHVTFFPKTDEHRALVHQKAMDLGRRGICFDSGGGDGERDWELDWSFHVAEAPDGELEERREDVERLIRTCAENVK